MSHLEASADGSIAFVFVAGSKISIKRLGQNLTAEFAFQEVADNCRAIIRPTSRQRDYLEFIEKYMLRFGISPAESDIQRHFLVSAPSVHSMVETLERRGFITRQPGMPRSIRLVGVTNCSICGGIHLKASNPEKFAVP